MDSKIKKIQFIAILGVMTFLTGTGFVRAEEQTGQVSAEAVSESVQKKVQEWRKLKAENPEEFKRLAEQRKQQLHRKVSEFREKNPEKFQTVKNNVLHGRREQLQKLRRQDPQEFQRVMGGRMQKFREWKSEDPEGFQKFSKNHPRAAEGFSRREDARMQKQEQNLQRRKSENPDQKPRFQNEGRPGIAERRANFRQETVAGRNELRNNRERAIEKRNGPRGGRENLGPAGRGSRSESDRRNRNQ